MYTVFIISWTVLSTVFFGIAIIAASFVSRNGNIPHKIAGIWARTILFVSRIRVTVKGFYHIDPSRSYIYMPNHQSLFDIPVLLSYLDVQFRWLAKKELFNIPIFGQAMKRIGYISIDRSNRKSAFESLLRAAEIIRNGVSVMIFPEGTRSKDRIIIPFKKGGFVLAVDSGVPIVPIIIHGTGEIMPKEEMLIRHGNVLLEIRQPIETSGYSRKNKDDLMEEVRQVICNAFEEGKKEVRGQG